MQSGNLHFLTVLIAILAINAQTELIQHFTVVEDAILLPNLESDYEYTEPIEVARRNLQSVAVTTETGQTLKNISNTNYSGLILYHEFPSMFVIGQIFQVRGKLSVPAASNGTYVSFNFINKVNTQLKYSYLIVVPSGSVEWKINIETRNITIGDYNMAFYATLSGSYNPAVLYQLRAPGADNNKIVAPQAPTGCSVSFINNKIVINWKQDGITPIEKISFNQNGKIIEYFLTNFQSTFEVPNKDFVSFTSGGATVSISSAYSSLNGLAGKLSAYSPPWTYIFTAGAHNFSETALTITLNQPIPWIVNVGSVITIQGFANVILYNAMKVEQPQNVVGTYNISTINSTTLPVGTVFSRTLSLTKAGVYVLEINANNGIAVLNRPIYVGTFLPLMPDFLDMVPKSMDQATINSIIASQPTTIDALRSNLLLLINQKRGLWGRASLALDANLNYVAQGHSNDMVTRNFFGHVNPDGLGPQDRATKAGLTYGIAENVAKNLDLTEGHNRLCRSPGHLENLINPNYTRVGLGIAKNSQGYLFITQNFAGPLVSTTASTSGSTSGSISASTTTTKLSASQLETLRIQIRDWIITNYPTAQQDPVLSDVVKTWLGLTTSDTIFNYTWNTAKYPSSYLSASTYTAPYSTTFTIGFVKGSHFKQPDSTYGRFGINAIQQADGTIKAIAEYAK